MARLIERIVDHGLEIAIIIRASHRAEGLEFVTHSDYSQQLAVMRHPKGHRIRPHVHNPVPRAVIYTQEVIFIRSGVVMADLYGTNREFLSSKLLYPGDVIFLAAGGHGFRVLEDAEMIEVKQGPYAGDKDKTVFE